MIVKSFTFNPFLTNCYVCHDDGEAVLIDPSSSSLREHQAVIDYLEAEDLTVRHLLLTHAHIDHIFGCAFFSEQFGQYFQMHHSDLPLIEQAEQQAAFFGIGLDAPPVPTEFLEEGEVITFGKASWEVVWTPGHSPGSICFHDAENELVIAGDVLFQGSIGRTDLWEGSLPILMESIFQKLIPMGDDTRVYPGHGPATTIGRERETNPFLTSGV